MAKRRALLVTAIVVVTLLAAAVAARNVVIASVLRGAVSMLGYRFDAARVRVTASSLDLLAPTVQNRSGEPVFSAAHVDVRFSLRDLLPGSRHRFGLTAVDLEKPVLTLIHHADGSYNVELPGASGPPTRPDTTPIDVRLRVRDGVVALIDRFIVPNQERRESLTDVRVDAVLAPHDPAYYRFDADLQDGARRYPLAGRGRFDHARLFASQHWYAAELPIGPLIDFAMATHAANLVDGRLHGVDARIYGFMSPDGSTDIHLGARAQLVDGKLFVAKLGAAVGDAHGPLRVYDDGLTTTGIDATLARVPLRLVGGVYGLAQPQVRFLLAGSGSLARLRTLAPSIAHRPIDGDIAFALRADGALAQPVVTGRFRSRRMTYGAYALSDLSGDVAVAGKDVQILGLAARYGPIALRGRGTVVLGDHIDSTIAAGLAAPAAAIPYTGSIVPGAAVQGVVVLRGTDSKLAAHGAIAASGRDANLDAPFALEPDGTGTVGPVALARRDGASLYARVAFDRPAGVVDAVVAAHRLSLRRAESARLPGFAAAALPPIAGTLDTDLVGEVRGSSLAAASGTVHLRRAGIAGIPLGDGDARFAGEDGTVALDDLFVHGPLGELRGGGAYANGLLAAEGRFRGRLEQLAPLLHGLRARGGIDAPVRFVSDGHRTVAQIAGARFANASVQGVGLRAASATLALQGRTIDVRGARLDAAGGAVVAQGTLGNGGTLRLSTGEIDAAQLRAAGLPLSSGRVVSVANVSGTLAAPRVDAGITLTGGHLRGAPLDALASGRYAAGRLQLDDVRAAYAGAVASGSGVVDGVTGGAPAPRLALAASVRGADIATLARDFRLPLRYPQGAIDADVRLAGPARNPALSGIARIAAGSINGLGFRDVVVPLRGDLRAVDVRGGRATFGSTTLGFDASGSAGNTRVALRGERVDLADFNDYFDAADTLSGRGRLSATVALGNDTIATSGDLALAGAQFRRFPIGDLDARWSTRGRTIAAQAHVIGAHGKLSAGGSAIVPPRGPLARIARSTVDLQAQIAGLDLTTWLPAAGITAPVTGRVDASARVRGSAPNLALAGNAALHDGVVGRVPVRTLTLGATFDRGRGRITGARLEALNLVADGSGTFGLAAGSPLDLTLHSTSPDVGVLARGLTGKAFDGSGALDATLHLRGSRNVPAIALLADLDAPRYARVSGRHAHADVALGGGKLVARDISLDLAAGRIAFNGSIPASAKPPFIDRRNAPLAARLLAQQVDLGQFAPLLPQGTKLGGIVDGDVAVSGTLHDPLLHGSAGLAKGTFVSPFIASEVRDATLQLGFAGHGATVQTLHADVGGGAVDGSGAASIGDLSAPAQTLAFHLATTEKNVGLDVPRYFRGKVDGTLSLSRDAGAPVLVAGKLDFSHTRIPLSALLPSNAAKTPSAAPLPIAFDLTVAATNDDRLQSPNVDIGAKGSAVLGGTLAKPTLDGSFDATDGTVSLYRSFTLQKAHVAFDPSSGIIPNIDVTATTQIPNPPTDVLLHAHGPATGLALDLSSRPSYDKAQIVGLLVNAQALGAVSGVASTSPNGAGGSNLLRNTAVGYIDQQFTRGLFEPFSSSVGKSLGFSTLSLNTGLSGGFSARATRSLGSKLSASFAQSTNPQSGQRQSAGLAYNASATSAVQLTLFDAGTGGRTIGVGTPLAQTGPMNFQLEALAPPPGSSGYFVTYVRKF